MGDRPSFLPKRRDYFFAAGFRFAGLRAVAFFAGALPAADAVFRATGFFAAEVLRAGAFAPAADFFAVVFFAAGRFVPAAFVPDAFFAEVDLRLVTAIFLSSFSLIDFAN